MSTPARTMNSREFNQSTGRAKAATRHGPVYITNRGRPSHVLMSYDHYLELTEDKTTLADVLCRTPGIGDIEVAFPRSTDLGRSAAFD